jgi:hypothetical protein
MAKWLRGFVVLGAIGLLVVSAAAQEQRRPQFPRGGFGFLGGAGGDVLFLIGNEPVQEELKLTDQQKKLIQELLADYREKSQAIFQSAAQDRQERQKRFEELRTLNQKTRQAMEDILEPAQNSRLKQIGLQFRGVFAFLDEEVVSKLELTQEQRDKIGGILEGLRAGRGGGPGAGGGGQRGRFEEMRQRNEKALQEVLALLTEEQQKRWKELIGAPFDLSKLRPAGGFGPGRRGGEGGPDGPRGQRQGGQQET